MTSYVDMAKSAYKSSVRFSATLVRANIDDDLKVTSVWSWGSVAATKKVQSEPERRSKQFSQRYLGNHTEGPLYSDQRMK